MFNLLKIEFYKLKTSRIFYFSILLNILQDLILYVFSVSLKVIKGSDSLRYTFRIQNSLASTLIIGIFVSDYIVTEFTSGYIKNLVSSGHKRQDIFLSKAIVCCICTIIINFIGPIFIMSINIIKGGIVPSFDLNLLFTTILIYIAVGCVCTLTAFIIRNYNAFICTVIGFDFINRVLNVLSVHYSAFETIVENCIFSEIDTVMVSGASAFAVYRADIISLISIFISITAGIVIFKKLDIK